MKNGIIDCAVLAVTLLASQTIEAQGTTYLSNLGQSSAGSISVGSNSWLAAGFYTGTNTGGYSLNYIQLGMADASGNPSGFTVMLYPHAVGGFLPARNSIGTLSGSTDPATAGIYTYTSDSAITLAPRVPFFIVVTAGTAVTDGAYEWSLATANSYDPSGGWFSLGDVWTSTDGSMTSWNGISSFPQFAINATPVPEPGVLGLFTLGGLCLLWHRRKAKAVQ